LNERALRRAELDREVLARAQEGARDALERLVLRYERPVFALLSRMLVPKGRAAIVRDLAHETFAQVLRSLRNFDPDGPARLSSWILTIATRVALRELEAPRLVAVPIESARHVRAAGGERAVEQSALRAGVVRTLSELAPHHQAVLILRVYHELDYEEIAAMLEIDVGTVRSRLARAREALRRALGDLDP
jgi:RNA polymerase sigma-70 factor, ECF subfamily